MKGPTNMTTTKWISWDSVNNPIITLKNAVVTAINYDQEFNPGYCDTSNYGDEYIQNITVDIYKPGYKYESIEITFEHSFHFPINVAKLIQMLIKNLDVFKEMTTDEFKTFMESLPQHLDEDSDKFYDQIENW